MGETCHNIYHFHPRITSTLILKLNYYQSETYTETDTPPGGLYTKPRLEMDAAITAGRHTNTWIGTHSLA